jgi:hypothetical protein
MTISETVLDEAIKAEACKPGLVWTKEGHTYEATAEQHPDWYLWGKGNCPSWEGSPERLDKCAKAMPRTALEYAAQYLTPKRLDKCAEAEPRYALMYAARYLTPERLDECAEAEPCAALMYAAQYLTPERLDKCAAQAEPWAAL